MPDNYSTRTRAEVAAITEDFFNRKNLASVAKQLVTFPAYIQMKGYIEHIILNTQNDIVEPNNALAYLSKVAGMTLVFRTIETLAKDSEHLESLTLEGLL